MPYATPTPNDFKARYPEFAAVEDLTVAALVSEAEGEVGATWVENDRRPAVMAFAAHLLASSGFAFARAGTGAPIAVAGPLRSSKVGDVEESYGAPGTSKAGDKSSATDLDGTAYGQRFIALRRRSFPSAMVV
jgi:hypothetical protein